MTTRGLRTRAGKPLAKQSLDNIFSDSFYAGISDFFPESAALQRMCRDSRNVGDHFSIKASLLKQQS
jgi:hypothetical protein